MRKELSKEEVYLFADIKNADADTLILVQRYLNPTEVRSLLIKDEYTRRTKSGIAIKKDIIKSLSKRYGVSRSYVEAIVYHKDTSKGKLCVRCNKFISKFIWNKNGGVCNRCKLNIQYTNDKERRIERDEISQG
ncbi:MAG: hypothetical protein SNJ29_12995 [Rikenellaceae bacterium]